MNNTVKFKSVRSLVAFAIGAFATLLLYAYFYLQNADVIHDFLDRHGVLGGVLATFALFVLASGSGLWAVFCRCTTPQAAFTVGLGLPSMIATALAGATGSKEVYTASVLPILSFQEDEKEPGLFRDALEMVFSPFTATEKVRGREKARQVGVLKSRLSGVTGERDQFLRERDDFKQRYTDTEGDLRSVRLEHEEAVRRLEGSRLEMSALNTERDALLDQVNAFRRADAALAAYSSAYKSLGIAAGPNGIPSLHRTLQESEVEEVVIDTISIVGRIPRAIGNRPLIIKLEGLERSGSKAVRSEAKLALQRLNGR